ncbi:MAG TPA: 6-carboxytetrahydropterin synthase [Anaerolineaceae bacterium]|nr:6-carboxytetrahydropterin synthase [Anaerolineaceae bacterium]
MYRVAVRRDFIAQHYLIGGDWGRENERHSHHYVMELELSGEELDEHGYLADITAIEACLETAREHYRDSLLNDLPEFTGLNPSLEHFCRILCQRFDRELNSGKIRSVTVRLWENEIAWAAYELEHR